MPMPTARILIVLSLLFLAGGMQSGMAAEILISTENTPSHFQTVLLQSYAERLNNDIPGHEFRLVHSAKAFRDRDVAEALSSGRVAIASPGIWHLGRYSNELNALLLPSFMGLGASEVRAVVDGPFELVLRKSLEDRLNVKVIGRWLDLGPAHIFTRDKEIRNFNDLKGLRIRYAGGEGNALRLAAMGAVPVLIPWPSVPEALDREEIDGLLTTTSSVVSASLWENGIKHAFLCHSYYPFYVPLISGDIWQRLTKSQRGKIRSNWEAMIDHGRQMAIDHQNSSLVTLAEKGVSIMRPSEDERHAIRMKLVAQQTEMARTLGISDRTLITLERAKGR